MVELWKDLAQARRSRIFIRLESISEGLCIIRYPKNRRCYTLSNAVE